MTCRHFQRLLRSSVQMSVEGAPSTLLRLVLSNSCSKKYFGTSPAKFKLEVSNLHDVFYHRSYIVSIKNITRLSCTPGLVQFVVWVHFYNEKYQKPERFMFIGTQCDLWGRPDGTGHEKISRGNFPRLIFSLIPSLFERYISIGCADLIRDITLD